MTLFLLSVLIATVTADVRLTKHPRGTLEVKVGNSWHEVCGHYFWDNGLGASNACKEMGYASGGRYLRVPGTLSNAVYIGTCDGSQVPGRCTGRCQGKCAACRNKVNCGDCKNGERAKIEVQCFGLRGLPLTPTPTQRPTPQPTLAPTPAPTHVRLTKYPRGTLEVKVGNSWHEVCGHYFWDNGLGASNACKEMGYASGGRYHRVPGTLSNAVYVGTCDGSQVPGRCTGRCQGKCAACRNKVNCGDCKNGERAKIEVQCFGQRGLPLTPTPTQRPTLPPTPAPTQSPTQSPTEEASYGNIMQWLEGLIKEGNQEVLDINGVLNGRKDDVKKASDILGDAQQKEGEAKSRMDKAKETFDEAKGSWIECEKNYNNEKERLDAEIIIFTKVKNTLDGLLNGQQLNEIEDEVKAFISLADQADPEKVKQIMTLVQKLLDVTKAQLISSKEDLDRCKDSLESAEAAYNDAVGNWDAASIVVKDKQKDLDEVQGKLTAYQKYASERIGVVQVEIQTMENIISLLEPLLE